MERVQNQLQPPRFADPILMALGIGLVLFSIVMVYSTTGVMSQEKFGDPYFYAKRQMVAAAVGIVAMIVCSWIDVSVLKRISPYLYVVCLACLLLTMIPGIGDRAGGAQRWLNLGIVRFQPGEVVKLAFVIFAAGFFARHESQLNSFMQGILKPSILMGIICVLFLKQPDFGSCVVIALCTLGMGAAAGVKFRHLALCAFAGIVTASLLVLASPYRMKRIISFMDPFADPGGKGYQLIQSLIAVGSGQFSGVGLGASQQKLFFLPAAHTDFIFAVISEELGFVGSVAILIPFLLILWRGLALARRMASDTFCFSLAVGATLLVVVPALLNVGVVTGILPTKGMVLPLVGYGGSSLVISLMSIGILLGAARSYQKGTI